MRRFALVLSTMLLSMPAYAQVTGETCEGIFRGAKTVEQKQSKEYSIATSYDAVCTSSGSVKSSVGGSQLQFAYENIAEEIGLGYGSSAAEFQQNLYKFCSDYRALREEWSSLFTQLAYTPAWVADMMDSCFAAANQRIYFNVTPLDVASLSISVALAKDIATSISGLDYPTGVRCYKSNAPEKLLSGSITLQSGGELAFKCERDGQDVNNGKYYPPKNIAVNFSNGYTFRGSFPEANIASPNIVEKYDNDLLDLKKAIAAIQESVTLKGVVRTNTVAWSELEKLHEGCNQNTAYDYNLGCAQAAAYYCYQHGDTAGFVQSAAGNGSEAKVICLR